MNQVTLQFETPQNLASFRKMVQATFFAVNVKDLTLTCSCTEHQIAIAINTFGAKVLETKVAGK